MHNYKSQSLPHLVLPAIAEPAPAILCTTDPVFAGNEDGQLGGQGTRDYSSLIHDTGIVSKDDSETVKSANSHDSEAFSYALEVLRRANGRFPGGHIPVNLLPPNLCELPSGFQPIHPEPFTKEEKERRNDSAIFIPSSYIKQKESTHSFFRATWTIYLTDDGLSAITTVRRGGQLLLEIDNVLDKPVTCPMYYFTRLRLLHSDMAYVEAFAYTVDDLVVPQTCQGWPPIVLCLPASCVMMAYSKDMVVWGEQMERHVTKERKLTRGSIWHFFSRLFPRRNLRKKIPIFYPSPFHADGFYDEPVRETTCLEVYFL